MTHAGYRQFASRSELPAEVRRAALTAFAAAHERALAALRACAFTAAESRAITAVDSAESTAVAEGAAKRTHA
jgi:hypothetical protein